MEKSTDRKRARDEEGLQLQSCHVKSVSNLISVFIFFIFNLCTWSKVLKCTSTKLSLAAVEADFWLRRVILDRGILNVFSSGYSN